LKYLKLLFGVITGIAVLIVYQFTLAPTVLQIDTGELATVQAILGIAHPTGYPLFSIMGYLWTFIPIGGSTIHKLNILASVWCAGGIVFFIYSIKNILANIDVFVSPNKQIKSVTSNKKKKDKMVRVETEMLKTPFTIPEFVIYFSAIFSALILAFSKTFWMQSTSVEVYSLHIFFMGLILFLLTVAFVNSVKLNNHKYWFWFAGSLALGFSNHMTTLLLLPATAYLYFLAFGFSKNSILRIVKMLAIFFPLLILFYSYLPIRASQNPILNWGNTIDVERILRHISGKQYQVWLFSSFDSAKKQLLFFFNNLPSELTINLILSIIGLFLSYFKARRFFVFTLILLISTIFYSINYDIVDIDTYFLLAYFALSMFAAFGIVLIFDWLKHKKLNNNLAAITIFVFISVHVGLTFNKVNQSDIYIFEDYTKELLASSDHNSIIFSYQWDYFLSASYYFQFVEDYRRDLIIIDKELLRRSWYYNQLENYHPGIISSLQPTVDQFLQALKPFERSENFNPQLLENLFQKIMTDLVAVNYDKRTFYIAPEVFENEMQKGQFALPEGYTLVPEIFFFKVNKGGEYLHAKDPEFSIRFPEKRNYYHDTIEKLIGGMLVRRALYEMQYDKLQRAKVYIKKLKKEFPDYPVPKGLTEVINRSTSNIE
jgi:tetratricopeptide (TPR) repeat protein